MIKILEFGYSLKHDRYFIKFFINGMEDEKGQKLMDTLKNIPDGNLKRFDMEEYQDGFIVLERFSKKEYPFNNEIPSEKEISSTEEMVKGLLEQMG